MPIDEAVLGEFSLHTLRECALLADGKRGALIGPRGDVSWVSAQSWPSDAIFSILIGGDRCDAVTPSGRHTWGG